MNKTQKLEKLLSELSQQYREKYGHDWLCSGGQIRRAGTGYYLVVGSQSIAFLGRYERAVRWLNNYLETGKPTFAVLRLR